MLIHTGDRDNKILTSTDDMLIVKYLSILQSYNLHQHTLKTTPGVCTLLDHAWSNIPQKIKMSDFYQQARGRTTMLYMFSLILMGNIVQRYIKRETRTRKKSAESLNYLLMNEILWNNLKR